MELSTGTWQVTVVDPVVLPLVAVIVAEPPVLELALQVTRPADTVATLVLLELQVADAVRVCVGPDE